jgi:putative addiction module CopG family antidote
MKIDLSPALDQFVAEKIKSGTYVDAAEVIRDSLRRWKEQEELLHAHTGALEDALREGFESPDLTATKTFWGDLRGELHKEHDSGTR